MTGTIQYYNNQGNFCPTTRDCSGTYYPQSEFHAYVPVRDTRVYIRRDSDSAIIGQGSTNAGGQFTISWSIPGGTGDVQANLIWVGEHKDGRFAIRASDGSQYIFWTMPFTLHSHGTDSVGALSWGTENSPNPIANVYDGAWRTWRQFSLSNRLVTYFTGVEIRYPSSDCPTSCTSGSDKLVKLDPDSAYAPQARVMHELGHVASYVSNRDQSRSLSNDYCYPNTGGNCGWSLQTAEWSQDAFEEGFATFAGDTALASPWSTAPHTCYQSAAACSTGHHNEESSPGATGQCASDENRFPLSVVRYLWDAYDFNVDYPTETLARDPHEFFDTLNSFDNGRDNHQKDEPQCCILGYCYLCTRDGRSAVDFKWNWANWGTDSSSAWTNNCSPTGD
ncbi:MAG: hypothetical protein JST92_00600 [Deltaproteobacteria bacterium]|nr:hypothetical protein [Deltaproteobacteria bacterium]